MEATEIRKLAELEDTHWWYRERRRLLARALRTLGPPGRALDVGAGGGGNTRVLRQHGWETIALEFSQEGAEVARDRGLTVLRADARRLPLASGSVDLVTAFDVLEHIDEDHLAAAEMHRVLRPGGVTLIAVPCDPKLWSAHDEAVHHVRRYTRETLRGVMEQAGFTVDALRSWNVLLRPVAAWRRKRSSGSDLSELPAAVNAALFGVVAMERHLPVHRLPGVSLLLRAHRPA
jgi:SAM-dependent methyltransferase